MKSFREDCWLTSLSVKLPAERFLQSIYYCMFEDHWSLWMLSLLSWRILPTVTTKTQVSASGSPCEEPTCCAWLLASSLLWSAVIWAQRAQSQGLRYSETGHLRSQYCFQVKCLHRWEKPHQQFVRAWSCWGARTGQVPWLREELHSSSGVLWAEGEPGWECGFVLFFPAFAFLVCVWKQSFSGQRQFHNIRWNLLGVLFDYFGMEKLASIHFLVLTELKCFLVPPVGVLRKHNLCQSPLQRQSSPSCQGQHNSFTSLPVCSVVVCPHRRPSSSKNIELLHIMFYVAIRQRLLALLASPNGAGGLHRGFTWVGMALPCGVDVAITPLVPGSLLTGSGQSLSRAEKACLSGLGLVVPDTMPSAREGEQEDAQEHQC